ncbi:MAG: GNAT family N-acetyltransferase [Rhodobacteraceae bacterium]|nr:GNAT family N-acetyltransferase [Paracoccaceae bacterium]
MTEIRIMTPEDTAWVMERHLSHYCSGEGFDSSFASLVTERLATLRSTDDWGRECGWIAWSGGSRLGSIVFSRDDPETARLRLFYVVPDVRGKGIGRALLARLESHARACGCICLRVATHAEHREARRLYARSGFRRGSVAPVVSFGRALTEEHWEKPLGVL